MKFEYSIKILIVDDVSDNILLLQTFLEAENYQIETADSGELALQKIESSPPDIILLDVMMPKMNGYQVAQKIRQNRKLPFIPILLITALNEENVKEEWHGLVNGSICKPFDFCELLTKIRAVGEIKQTVLQLQ